MNSAALDEKSNETAVARVTLLLALLIGFALRLLHLGAESLWYDETVSVHLSRQPIPAMVAHTAGDIHPPGYYLLLHLWQQLTAPTLLHGLEFLYAFPSVIAAMAVLALLYAIGRRLFNAKVALVAISLAAVNPFQLWYSQEVRMYTVGAALGLLCLWALLAFAGGRHKALWLVIYALAAAAGLYTLYYFAFWLIALNLAALLLLWAPASGRGRRFAVWLAAQGGALVLFAPWLPVVARQVTDPPVPPWREPWPNAGALLASIGETLAALLVGQSPPGAAPWPWAIPVLALVAGFGWWAWGKRGQSRRGMAAATVLILVFVPIGLLFAITLVATPIYHVRYIYLYATLFMLVPAALLVAMWRRWPVLGGAALFLLLAISAWSLHAFWTNPLYRADDHRGAVAQLAAQWRPGDAILANAGWIYPVLTTYWPVDVAGVDGSVPPPISTLLPVDGYAQFATVDPSLLETPAVARSGSVDGEPSLGWGNPAKRLLRHLGEPRPPRRSMPSPPTPVASGTTACTTPSATPAASFAPGWTATPRCWQSRRSPGATLGWSQLYELPGAGRRAPAVSRRCDVFCRRYLPGWLRASEQRASRRAALRGQPLARAASTARSGTEFAPLRRRWPSGRAGRFALPPRHEHVGRAGEPLAAPRAAAAREPEAGRLSHRTGRLPGG